MKSHKAVRHWDDGDLDMSISNLQIRFYFPYQKIGGQPKQLIDQNSCRNPRTSLDQRDRDRYPMIMPGRLFPYP